MTNQTNLDYLFKLTSPLPERSGAGSTLAHRRRPAFDDHLVNASASAPGAPSSSGLRTNLAESAPAASDSLANRAQSGNDRAASDDQPTEDSPRVDAAASDDANTKSVDDTRDDTAATDDGADTESAGDVATNDDENNSAQDAAEDVATATLVEQATALRDKQTTRPDDHVAGSAKGDAEHARSPTTPDGNFDGRVGRRTGDLPEGELRAADLESEDVTSNFETNENKTGPSAGERAKRSSSKEAMAADGKPQKESAAEKRHGTDGASADATAANAKKAINPAKLKSEKATGAGRRPARESEISANDSDRVTGAHPTQPGDATTAKDQATPVAVANGANAQVANSLTKVESGDEARQAIKPLGHATEGLHMTGRAQRAGATAKGRAHAASADLPRVDGARFVGRVAKAVQTAQERGGLVQLRLSPPELGSLRLELSMHDGVMTAAVETETPAARQILLDHLPALRDRLAEQNIRIERFDVDVRQENSGGQADPRASQQEQRQHQPQQPNPRHAGGRPAATQAPTGDAPHVLTRLSNSALNVLA